MRNSAVLLKVTDASRPKLVRLPQELKEIYSLLEVDCIDIVRRKINTKYYTVICDDEGALKEERIVSGVGHYGKIEFFGNLLICSGKPTSDGELMGLTEEEAKDLLFCVYYTKEGYKLFGID